MGSVPGRPIVIGFVAFVAFVCFVAGFGTAAILSASNNGGQPEAKTLDDMVDGPQHFDKRA